MIIYVRIYTSMIVNALAAWKVAVKGHFSTGKSQVMHKRHGSHEANTWLTGEQTSQRIFLGRRRRVEDVFQANHAEFIAHYRPIGACSCTCVIPGTLVQWCLAKPRNGWWLTSCEHLWTMFSSIPSISIIFRHSPRDSPAEMPIGVA